MYEAASSYGTFSMGSDGYGNEILLIHDTLHLGSYFCFFSVNFNEFLPLIHFSIDMILTPFLHFCFVFVIFFLRTTQRQLWQLRLKSCLSVKLALVKAIIVPSSDMSQTKDHPGSGVRQKCVGGVMDWEHSQERAATGLSTALQLDTLRQFQLLFFSPNGLSLDGSERWLKVWNKP